MKPFLAIVAGFVATLGMFGGGLVFATYLIAVEPVEGPRTDQDVAQLWTQKPRKVDPAEQDFERVPATTVAADTDPEMTGPAPTASVATASSDLDGPGGLEIAMADTGTMSDIASSSIDTITTGNIALPASERQEQEAPLQRLPAAHVEWCFSQYRSYRPEDDSYTAYSGEQKPCTSPYSTGIKTAAERDVYPVQGDYVSAAEEPSVQPLQYASGAPEAGAYLSAAHMQECLDRYRSYRPEDNTYQPYGGGPRQQCR